MRHKILVTTTTFPRWANDTTPRFVYELCERLAAKYGVIVVAPHAQGSLKKEKIGKLDVKRFAYFKPESMQKLCYNGGIMPNMKESFLAKIQLPSLIFCEFIACRKIMKRENVSMVHAHWILPQGLVAVFLKKFFKVPLLVTVHGTDLFPLKKIFYRMLQNFVIKNADFATVNSKATENELLQRFPEHSAKIKTIPMGIDIKIFRKIKIKKPKKYSKNKILLFVGRLSEQKGLQYLIESLSSIVKRYPKAKLLVIGEGAYKKTLQEIVNKKKLGKYVEFLGAMPSSELPKHYNFADVFILPSLSAKTGTEALGLSLLEAMSCGCAVIGTDVGGIKYIIKNGYNGIIVRQKDSNAISNAIIKLLGNKKMAEKFGKNAAEFARKNYSWENAAKEFIRLYDKILK
ncbi:glycosyltransferase family 4 protein [Candidatus Woesearchaeota archaeon]|nr:glycosyltransferase family 4 protein [Candidatus Woesearchaeota archaeon]